MANYRGTIGPDIIIGTDQADTVYDIGQGIDVVNTLGGDDTVYVTPGRGGLLSSPALVNMGQGNDLLIIDGSGLSAALTMSRPLLDVALFGLSGGINIGGAQQLVYTGVERFQFQGGSGADNIALGSGDDLLNGNAGDDRLDGGGGNDTIDGGAGIDTAVFSGARADYSILRLSPGTVKVVDTRPGTPDGSDTVVNVEKLQFSDFARSALLTPGDDLDGRGRSDLLFRNESSGGIVAWEAASSSAATVLGGVGAEWSIFGGDIDGDGRGDIIFRNTGTGQNIVWNGGLQSTAHSLTPVETAWKLLLTGDFNGDGRGDLFFRNSDTGALVSWNGGDSSQASYLGGVGTEWRIQANDLDGDGRTDLIFQNYGTGALIVWNGGDNATAHALTPLDPVWRLAASGDFDGDGKADLVFLNSNTGAVMTWGGGDSARAVNRGVVATNSQLVVGDYDGDARSDLLVHDLTSGALTVWAGADASTARQVGGVGADWHVFG